MLNFITYTMNKFLFALIIAITTFCGTLAQPTIYLHVEQPGTLGELIGNFKYRISSLKLTGKLNGSDIAIIRDMGGHRQAWHADLNAYLNIDSDGILQNLDLSGTDIVEGGEYVSVITYIDNTGYKNAGFYTENNTISGGMFRDLETLETVILPNSAVSIQDAVFQGDTNLKSIVIGKNVKEIGEYVFAQCESLCELSVKNPEPPTSKFVDETDLSDKEYERQHVFETVLYGFDIDQCQLIIPKGTREAYKQSKIWRYFFDTRTVLETVFVDDVMPADNEICCFPGMLDRIIGANRYNLESIKLSGYMDANDIAVLRDMMGIVVDKEGNITHTDGRLSEIDMSEVELVPGPDCYYYGQYQQGFIMNKSLLPCGIFAGCENLKSVVLPFSTKFIGEWAFWGCKNLERCPINDAIEVIESAAFEGCDLLKEVQFGQSLSAIGSRAFYNCPIERVIIPDGVIHIEEHAFYSDTDLQELSMGSSVESIGEQAFGRCDKLEEIHVNATTPPKAFFYDENEPNDRTFFNSIDFENCRLVVPFGTYAAYSSAPIWSLFKNIRESTTTGIDDIITDVSSSADIKEIYDINGKRLNRIQPGLNVVRMSNGKVKKIIVK